MSVHTHSTRNSPMFNAWQHFCSPLVPVVSYNFSGATGVASGMRNAGAVQKPMGLLKRLGQRIERKQMERREAYLAESADICDLENRMKQIGYLHF